MPAALHQLKVIERFEVGFGSRQRCNDRVIRVVNQHQDVRQLQRRGFTNLDARGQAVNNRALGGTNQAGGSRLVVVTLQIQTHDHAMARVAGHAALDVHHAVVRYNNTGLQIVVHGPANRRDALGRPWLVQIHLGKHQLQG